MIIKEFNPYRDLESTYVAVDYDGTLIKEDGSYDEDAIVCLQNLSNFNIKFILWSCRPVDFLEKVADDFKSKYHIVFSHINDNCDTIKKVYDIEGRKIFAHFYIDDQACGFRKIDWYDIERMILSYHMKRVNRGDCDL